MGLWKERGEERWGGGGLAPANGQDQGCDAPTGKKKEEGEFSRGRKGLFRGWERDLHKRPWGVVTSELECCSAGNRGEGARNNYSKA